MESVPSEPSQRGSRARVASLLTLPAGLCSPTGSSEVLAQAQHPTTVRSHTIPSLEEVLQYQEGFERKKTAALLFTGALMGFLGFMFAGVIGIKQFLDPEMSEYHRTFESGNGYFPSTVSEMVYDPRQPAGKCFFSFEFVGALLIFQSWYPWRLRNVYLGDSFVVQCLPQISWMMFRQFVPSLGMILVATVTTVPFKTADALDYICIAIHLTAAVMLFAGYVLVEAITIGWGPFRHCRQEVTLKTIGTWSHSKERTHELAIRKMFTTGIVFAYATFCSLQGVLMLPTCVSDLRKLHNSSFFGQCDVWGMSNVTDSHGYTHQMMILTDTASGGILMLKIASYVSEVFCGMFLIGSLWTIWYYSHERLTDLRDELPMAVSDSSDASSEE